MLKLKYVLCAVVVISLQLSVIAQNNTDSPYSRNGYGLLANPSSSAGLAMGGIGYGTRISNQINPLNPASYSNVDSLTFLFDMGTEFQMSWYTEGVEKQKNYNGNINNINMLFPIGKKFAVSAGFLPVSYVGYNYVFTGTEGGLAYQQTFTGTGGFQQIYGGLSYKVLPNLSIGANIGYLFGNINHATTTVISQTGANPQQDSIRVKAHDLTYTIGLQYTHPLSNDYSITIGGAYTPKINLTATGRSVIYSGGVIDSSKIILSKGFEIAQSIGGGLSFVKKNKFLIGADVLYQDWANVKFYDKTDTLKNRIKFSLGGEFIPNYRSRKFFDRIQYRLGGYYSNSYIATEKGGTYKEFGATVGMGLPIYNKSVLQISFGYVKIKPDQPGLIDEQYFKVTLNYTFNETWFRKWKIN